MIAVLRASYFVLAVGKSYFMPVAKEGLKHVHDAWPVAV